MYLLRTGCALSTLQTVLENKTSRHHSQTSSSPVWILLRKAIRQNNQQNIKRRVAAGRWRAREREGYIFGAVTTRLVEQ